MIQVRALYQQDVLKYSSPAGSWVCSINTSNRYDLRTETPPEH